MEVRHYVCAGRTASITVSSGNCFQHQACFWCLMQPKFKCRQEKNTPAVAGMSEVCLCGTEGVNCIVLP